MSRHFVRAAFVNLIEGAKFTPTGGQSRAVPVGARVSGPGEFETPDKEQADRLTKAGCLIDPTADAKAAAKAEAARNKADKDAKAAREAATAARAEATRLRDIADKASAEEKAKAEAAAVKAETAADKAEAEAVTAEAAVPAAQ